MSLLVTGVAICSTELNAAEPIPIQQWPGSDATGIKITNKVPTLVTYKAADLRVQSWGFACPPRKDLGDMALRGRFKFLLDSEVLDKANETCIIPESIENIKKFFADFLEELHGHIVTHLEDAPWNVDWGFTKVEYIFSLPTSWESKDYLVEEFSAIIGDAGFGSEDNSTLTIGLTEGVASAVCTAKSVKHKFSVSHLYGSLILFPF
jgi:hypothetical protein